MPSEIDRNSTKQYVKRLLASIKCGNSFKGTLLTIRLERENGGLEKIASIDPTLDLSAWACLVRLSTKKTVQKTAFKVKQDTKGSN